MNILFQLSHPAHFHLFKNVAKALINNGHNVHILIKSKDILEDLLLESGLPYCNILPKAHRKNKMGVAFDMLLRDWRIFWYCINHHIDILCGSTPEVAQVGWILQKHRINFGEDDASVIPEYIKVVKHFIDCFVCPTSCNSGILEPRSIHYPGYHKLAYLHPNQFTPDKSVVEKYFPADEPFFLLRFAQLKAYHDLSAHAQGITTDIAQRLIDILKPHGKIYITSERALEPQFEQYRLHINPLDIHHVMAFATMYIGDSQSMAVEAAMLGTPSIRFNDFAGKIGVLEELESKYQLTVGIPANQPDRLYEVVSDWLSQSDLRSTFQSRRAKMLSEKIDVTAFFTTFIENYPQSVFCSF